MGLKFTTEKDIKDAQDWLNNVKESDSQEKQITLGKQVINGSDQAFPGKSINGFERGVDVLSHFALHAPGEIPEWFKHNFRNKPSKRPYLYATFGAASNHPLKDFYKYFNDEDGEWYDTDISQEIPQSFKDEVKAHLEGLNNDVDEQNKWEYENNVARYFQWRIFYAQQMINALNANK